MMMGLSARRPAVAAFDCFTLEIHTPIYKLEEQIGPECVFAHYF